MTTTETPFGSALTSGPYSPKCVAEVFCELRSYGVLRSSAKNSFGFHRRLLALSPLINKAGLMSPADLYRRCHPLATSKKQQTFAILGDAPSRGAWHSTRY